MKNLVLMGGIALGLSWAPLQAGRVMTLTDNQESEGKLTLQATTLQVEGAFPAQVNLSDILEADFAGTPFQVGYFSSNDSPDRLPPDWKALDIGRPAHPGSFSYAKGALTLTGWGNILEGKEDQVYFMGRPWSGNGQWTVRLQPPDTITDAESGLMLRDSLDPPSPMVAIGVTGLAGQVGQDSSPGWVHVRRTTGTYPDLPILSTNFPVWLRLTRNGPSIGAALSDDGKIWRLVYQSLMATADDAWIGFFTTSRIQGKPPGRAVLDQVSFTPPPCSARTVSPGALLRNGSFLAGSFGNLVLDPARPEAEGNFFRPGQAKPAAIPASKIAAVILQAAQRSELTGKGAQTGLIMRNGDFMEGDTGGISGSGAVIHSLVLGIVHYTHDEARAWVLHGLHPQPAPYEIRLNDGSSLRASGLRVSNGLVTINEVSGIAVTVAPDEIAQFRAGPAEVQNLIDLPWKVTEQAGSVSCWEGNDQEQIMVAPAGTVINFPLTGQFRALALRVALSPDAPPNAAAVVHLLADGREIGRTPPVKAGAPPHFVEMPLPDAQTVGLVADSPFAGARILYIDPVAIRE